MSLMDSINDTRLRVFYWFHNTWLSKLWSRFKDRYISRYHIINISGVDEYKHGWIDRDHAIFLACFKCLIDYIEGENPFEHLDWTQGVIDVATAKELKELYEWIKFGRRAERDATHALYQEFIKLDTDRWGIETTPFSAYNDPERMKWRLEQPMWQEYRYRYGRLDPTDDEMLLRLVKIRRHMWT